MRKEGLCAGWENHNHFVRCKQRNRIFLFLLRFIRGFAAIARNITQSIFVIHRMKSTDSSSTIFAIQDNRNTPYSTDNQFCDTRYRALRSTISSKINESRAKIHDNKFAMKSGRVLQDWLQNLKKCYLCILWNRKKVSDFLKRRGNIHKIKVVFRKQLYLCLSKY